MVLEIILATTIFKSLVTTEVTGFTQIKELKSPLSAKIASFKQTSTVSSEMTILSTNSTPLPTPHQSPSSTKTPKPSPTSTPKPLTLEELFTKYAQKHNIDREQLRRIAYCESRFNTNAGNGPYKGLYQFSENTWKAYRKRMGLRQDPALRTDAESAINTASYMLANGAAHSWPNCK